MEVGKNIVGYGEESKDYEVSSYGNVRSFKGKKQGVLLTPYFAESKQRLKVHLGINKRCLTASIQRLVLNAFSPNEDPSKDCVIHRDGDLNNNRLDNLYGGTRSEAMANRDNSTGVKIEYKGKLYISQSHLSRAIGLSVSSISKLVNGQKDKISGFVREDFKVISGGKK